jgi:hypothetical protein
VNDSARPKRRYRVCSLLAAIVVAAVALSPSAYADDGDLFSPTGPSIVVGGTVHPPTAIVVDPQTPSASTGPIDPAQSIGVDPRVRVPSPVCCVYRHGAWKPWWPEDGPIPVRALEQKELDGRTTYLDNIGRYWTLDVEAWTFEQVGGWPEAPKPRALPNRDPLPRGHID